MSNGQYCSEWHWQFIFLFFQMQKKSLLLMSYDWWVTSWEHEAASTDMELFKWSINGCWITGSCGEYSYAGYCSKSTASSSKNSSIRYSAPPESFWSSLEKSCSNGWSSTWGRPSNSLSLAFSCFKRSFISMRADSCAFLRLRPSFAHFRFLSSLYSDRGKSFRIDFRSATRT